MATQLYVNKPGGVIVHLADGSQETLSYGAPVDPDKLADHQKAFLDNFTDKDAKSESPAASETADRLKEAYQQSVNAHQGQVNSSANVVPGDYGALDVDGAVALMRALEAYPEAQAQVWLHEKVNYGRDKVLDAAGAGAAQQAQWLLEQTREQVLAQQTVVPDEDAKVSGSSGGDGDKYEQLKGDDLDKAVREADIEGHSKMSADEKRQALRDKDAGSPPATPPPTS